MSPDIRTLDQVRIIPRAHEVPHEGAFCDLMWSDPDDLEEGGWAVSPRGAGWLFGSRVTAEVSLPFFAISPSFVTVFLASSPRHRPNMHIRIASAHVGSYWSIQFNHLNSLTLIARAHQLVQEGFKHMFNESLVTVWSAPNYCYRCGNSASIMRVEDNGRTNFKVYEAAMENNTDNKNPALRRMVSLPFLIIWGPMCLSIRVERAGIRLRPVGREKREDANLM